MSRQPVADEKYVIRRIPPWSSNWRPPPNERVTSANFKDAELSVDISNDLPTEVSVRSVSRYEEFLKSGMGFVFANVGAIRVEFKKPKAEGGQNVDGDIYHDPIAGNPDHGIVTGKNNKRKSDILAQIFGPNLVIKPLPFSTAYSADH